MVATNSVAAYALESYASTLMDSRTEKTSLNTRVNLHVRAMNAEFEARMFRRTKHETYIVASIMDRDTLFLVMLALYRYRIIAKQRKLHALVWDIDHTIREVRRGKRVGTLLNHL